MNKKELSDGIISLINRISDKDNKISFTLDNEGFVESIEGEFVDYDALDKQKELKWQVGKTIVLPYLA